MICKDHKRTAIVVSFEKANCSWTAEMIESIRFQNFKALRDATLPLGRFTLIVGPNGSGKSTALQAFKAVDSAGSFSFNGVASAGLLSGEVKVEIWFGAPFPEVFIGANWSFNSPGTTSHNCETDPSRFYNYINRIRIYSLDAQAIAAPVQIQPNIELDQNGGKLAAVLDQLKDRDPERFESLNEEVGRLLPEFDRILFDTVNPGQKTLLLRTREGHYPIRATDLSQGTLLALAILTLAYLPEPPSIVCLEEPDRGIHPRLLRDIQDALYRLSHPESAGEKRPPVQVIATTHSPYMLDLYKDHPEEIVIANKIGQEARFVRLSDLPHIDEILQGAPLGEVWYTGILGGVPLER